MRLFIKGGIMRFLDVAAPNYPLPYQNEDGTWISLAILAVIIAVIVIIVVVNKNTNTKEKKEVNKNEKDSK